jgi:hypothetical protein
MSRALHSQSIVGVARDEESRACLGVGSDHPAYTQVYTLPIVVVLVVPAQPPPSLCASLRSPLRSPRTRFLMDVKSPVNQLPCHSATSAINFHRLGFGSYAIGLSSRSPRFRHRACRRTATRVARARGT